MNIDSATRVMHALASSAPDVDIRFWPCWPRIAAQLLQDGCRWPALTELAAMDDLSDQAVLEEVTRLAQQTRSDIEPTMNIWDIAAGLIACIWKQGDYDAGDAVIHLDSLWSRVPDSDRAGSRPEGVDIIGEGVGLWACFAHADVTALAEQVLTRALQLIPPDPFSVPVCHTVLEGFS